MRIFWLLKNMLTNIKSLLYEVGAFNLPSMQKVVKAIIKKIVIANLMKHWLPISKPEQKHNFYIPLICRMCICMCLCGMIKWEFYVIAITSQFIRRKHGYLPDSWSALADRLRTTTIQKQRFSQQSRLSVANSFPIMTFQLTAIPLEAAADCGFQKLRFALFRHFLSLSVPHSLKFFFMRSNQKSSLV